MTPKDLPELLEIDGTVESSRYLHLDRAGEGMAVRFSLEDRPLREKVIHANRLGDEVQFLARQIATGADEGIAVVAEHEGRVVAMLLAQADAAHGTLAIREVRVDYDVRRQGLATAMVYQAIQAARDQGLRAVVAESKTNNMPASELFRKLGFELAGVDTHRDSNHDLVKESVALFWYAALD
jgi:ribosomal protein S18 acetylase RimI-like enzyme